MSNIPITRPRKIPGNVKLRKRADFIHVFYGGVPSGPNAYLPANGPAVLAAIAKDAGHNPRILDYCTVSTTQRLYPDFYGERLQTVLGELLKISAKKNERGSLTTRDRVKQARWFLELKALDYFLARHRQREELRMADEVEKEVRRAENPVVGFSLYSGDSFSGSIRMAERLKQHRPDLSIFAGGPHVKFYREHIFRYTSAYDALAYWDSELTIAPLLEHALGQRNIESVPNIIFKRPGGKIEYSRKETLVDMNELPFPEYSVKIYPAMEGNREKIKVIVLEDRRGCENVCNFCVHPHISGKRVREKNPRRIIEEMQDAIRRYNIRAFRFGGSTSPIDSLEVIAREIKERKMTDVSYTAFLRAKDVKEEDFEDLKESGLKAVFIGVESGDQRVLDKMHKQVTTQQLEKTIRAAKEAGIFVVGSVIHPAPFATEESYHKTLDFISKVRPDSVPVQPTGIYPGTPYSEKPEEHNLEVIYPSSLSRVLSRLRLKGPATFDDHEFLDYLINYKINLHIPPPLWKMIPWKINGMAHKEFMSETMRFYEAIKEIGVIPNLTDEEALMAQLADIPYRQFQQEAYQNFFSGRWRDLYKMNEKINRGVTHG